MVILLFPKVSWFHGRNQPEGETEPDTESGATARVEFGGGDQAIGVGNASAQAPCNKDVQVGVWVHYGMDMSVFIKRLVVGKKYHGSFSFYVYLWYNRTWVFIP